MAYTKSKPTRGSRTKTNKAKKAKKTKKTAGVGGGMNMKKLDKNKKKRSTA